MHAESHLEVPENKRGREARRQCRFREIEGKSGIPSILFTDRLPPKHRELQAAHIHKDQFALARLRIKSQATPALWNAVLAA
jgi:hypothetical protein